MPTATTAHLFGARPAAPPADARTATAPIMIERFECTHADMTNKRVSRWFAYRLRASGVFREVPGRDPVEVDFAGTPLASLRQIAKRLAREQGRRVVEGWNAVTCPVCGGEARRTKGGGEGVGALFDATCSACGWHFTSPAGARRAGVR